MRRSHITPPATHHVSLQKKLISASTCAWRARVISKFSSHRDPFNSDVRLACKGKPKKVSTYYLLAQVRVINYIVTFAIRYLRHRYDLVPRVFVKNQDYRRKERVLQTLSPGRQILRTLRSPQGIRQKKGNIRCEVDNIVNCGMWYLCSYTCCVSYRSVSHQNFDRAKKEVTQNPHHAPHTTASIS